MSLPPKKRFISGKATKPSTKGLPVKEPKKLHTWLQSVRRHPAIIFIYTFFGLAGLLATLAGGFDLIYGGPPWPTSPSIESQDSNAGSSDILPFHITNTSGLFPIKSANLSCYVDLAFMMDADGKTILARDMIFTQGAVPIGDGINYNCDAHTLSVGSDGALTIGFAPDGKFLRTKPGSFRPPLTTIKLCVAVVGSYSSIFGTNKFQSAIFQWPDSPNAILFSGRP